MPKFWHKKRTATLAIHTYFIRNFTFILLKHHSKDTPFFCFFKMVSKKLARLAKPMCLNPSNAKCFSVFGKGSNPPLATRKASIFKGFTAFSEQWLATWLAMLLTFLLQCRFYKVFNLFLFCVIEPIIPFCGGYVRMPHLAFNQFFVKSRIQQFCTVSLSCLVY